MKKLYILFLTAVILVACGGTNAPTTEVTNVDIEGTVQARVKQELASTQEPTATKDMSPTTAPEKSNDRNRVILAGWSENYTKIEGLAFMNDVEFDIATSERLLFNYLDMPDIAAVIYTERNINDRLLYKLYDYLEGGGKIFFVYFDKWSEHNSLLQELFGVSIVEENVINRVDSIRFPENSLPSWASGLKIVLVSGYKHSIESYLVTNEEGGEKTFILSQESNSERMIYYSSANSLKYFWPADMVTTTSMRGSFFTDRNIDLMDNEQAALNMLNILSGK